jgi:hypothetical protein
MLVQAVLFGLIIIGIILLGVKLGIAIDEMEMQVFFWILYGVSILTFFMSLLCGYIYYVFRKKTGPLGPQGFQGEPGGKGDPGNCDQNLCRGRTLAILMGKLIEKYNKKPITTTVKNLICGYITNTTYGTPEKKVSEILKNWDLLDIKTYSDIFTQQLSFQNGIVEEQNILKEVVDGSASKFNDYARGTLKHLPNMNTSKTCST